MMNGVGPKRDLDLTFIKSDARRRLFQILDKFEGDKTIVFDDNLIGPFEFLADPNALRQHGSKLLLRLSDIKLTLTQTSIQNSEFILFMVRKDYKLAKQLAEILNRIDRITLAKTVLVFVPQMCASIEKILELNRVDLKKLHSIEELDTQLFLLDSDLISLENENVYRNIYLNDDHTSIHQIVEGLLKVEQLYGQIPRISGQGKAAKLVYDLLEKRRQASNVPQQIHHLVLIDRRADLITPLLTQLTYEGLLDELFGIQHGNVSLPAERFQKATEEKGPDGKEVEVKKPLLKMKGNRKFPLRSSEELFAKLRDCHINGVGEMIKQSAKKLQIEYDECNSEGMTIHEMGRIVKRLQHLKSAKTSHSNHVTMVELVHEQTLKPEFIYGLRIQHEILQEERLNRIHPDIDIKLLRQEPPLGIIRLICLQSMMANGLKPKISDQYQREIIQNYGHHYMQLLIQLERAHIWQGQERFYEQGYFSQLKSKFNLILDDVDECNPSHFSYVYGGYSPLSIVITNLLCQASNKLQFKALQENLRMLSPPTFSNTDKSTVSEIEESQTVLVFFVGGCTFSEISALRQLAQQDGNEYIVGTTSVINGDTFIKSLWPITCSQDESSRVT